MRKHITTAGVSWRELNLIKKKKVQFIIRICNPADPAFLAFLQIRLAVLNSHSMRSPRGGHSSRRMENCTNANAAIKISWPLVKAGANTDKLPRKCNNEDSGGSISSWNRRKWCLPSGAEWRISCVVQELQNPQTVKKSSHNSVSIFRRPECIYLFRRLLSGVKWEWFVGWAGADQGKALKDGHHDAQSLSNYLVTRVPEGCRCVKYRRNVCVTRRCELRPRRCRGSGGNSSPVGGVDPADPVQQR